MRFFPRGKILAAIIALLSLSFLAYGEVNLGVLSEDLPHWQEVMSRFQAQGGAAEIYPYSENYLYQQINFLVPLGFSQLDVVEVLDKWTSNLYGKLSDLSPWRAELEAAGTELVVYAGRVLGVRLPWRDDAFAAVPSRGDLKAAIPLLKLLAQGKTIAVVPKGTVISKAAPVTVLSIGPITIEKPKTNIPYVDGALELLLETMKKTSPTGSVAPLAYLPSAAREAVAFVAKLVGIPLSAGGGEITLVIKPLRPGARVAPLGVGRTVQAPSGLQKVTVSLSNLESVLQDIAARYGGQVLIKIPSVPVPLAVTSEGVQKIRADLYHAAGYRGSGVKIAVIDVGFAGLSASQARGDLPYSVITRDFTGRGIESDYSHGTAVAEIVHDVAPDAQLYLIKIEDEVDLDNAVSYCISEGIDIINHSLGWYNTNFYDGTGTIGDIVRRATSAGILWVQAAGNDALRHWEGNFTDTDGDGWLDTEITLTAQAGNPIMLYFTWDGWPLTSDDYDLFLYGPDGTLVASSTKTQAGTEEPTEFINYTAATSGTYRIRIQRASGTARRLELFSIYQDLSPHVIASSMPAPANAAEALSVGAISWSVYTTGPIEDYSSRGPTNDGRRKPDLVAPDDVTTGVTPYYSPFQGTSAAAPHVAGAAALLLSQDPSLDRASLWTKLLSYCISMGDPNTYGAGRLELSLPAAPKPDLVIDSITYTPSSPRVGNTVTFTVVVRNRGSGDAGSFAVELRDGGTARKNVSGLAAGATYTLYFTKTLSAASMTFTAVADPDDRIDEANETNNSRSVTVSAAYPTLRADAGGPYSGTAGIPITFDGRSSVGDIVSYTWDFGDGTSGSGAVVQHTYSAPGTYTVRLTVRDRYGRTATDTTTATVQSAPTPQGRLSTDKGVYSTGEMVRITFTNTGSVPITLPNTAPWTIKDPYGRIVYSPMAAMVITPIAPGGSKTWTWDQRDNAGARVPPGTYTVELRTQNAGTFTATFTIQAPALRAEAGGPYSGVVGVPVTFDGRGSVGDIVSYTWDFGDGTSGSGAVVQHIYSAPGTYTVRLTVRDRYGRTDTDAATVTVSLPAKPDLVIESISYEPMDPRVGDTITFYVRVKNVGGARAGRFYVRIHDGAGYQQGSLSGLNAGQSHTVTLRLPLTRSPETFTAVVDPYGRVDELDEGNNTKSITVTAGSEPLDLRLSLDKTTYTVGETVTVTVNLNRAANVYLVELDPWGRAVLIFPNASHPSPGLPAGRSTVRAVATEPVGAESLYGFAAEATVPLFPTSFGPTFPVLDTNGAHFLDQVRAWLQANLPAASWDEARANFRVVAAAVNRPPVARFTFAPLNPTVGQSVRFDASGSTDPDGAITQYIWDFGDGASGTGRVVTHTYRAAGTYTVRLTVRDDAGATDTTSATIEVGTTPGPTPPAGMPELDKPGIYVWGDPDNNWHITVYASPSWSNARKFQVKVYATAKLKLISVSSDAPKPRHYQNEINWNGSIPPGKWFDMAFTITEPGAMQLELLLDTDGDGKLKTTPARAKKIVYLSQCKTNPPKNPFVIIPAFGKLTLSPNDNFRVGYCVDGTFPRCRWTTWSIRDLCD